MSIDINADASPNALLNGHYAFLISGSVHPGLDVESFPGPYATAGSFVADGLGNWTSGVSDTNNKGSVTANQPFTGTFTRTYLLGSDNHGTMPINSSAGTVTLAFSVGSISSSGVATKGRIIFGGYAIFTAEEFDLQDTTAFLDICHHGHIHFRTRPGVRRRRGVHSRRRRQHPERQWRHEPAGNARYRSAAKWGIRCDFAYVGPRHCESHHWWNDTQMAFYVASAAKLLIISAKQATTNPLVFTGQALKQPGRPFSDSSLDGTCVLSTISYYNDVTAGLGTFDGAGSITLLQDLKNVGGVTSGSTPSETHSVASNGRVTVRAAGSTASGFRRRRAERRGHQPNQRHRSARHAAGLRPDVNGHLLGFFKRAGNHRPRE